MASLEGWNFTIKLCPRANKLARRHAKAKQNFGGKLDTVARAARPANAAQ